MNKKRKWLMFAILAAFLGCQSPENDQKISDGIDGLSFLETPIDEVLQKKDDYLNKGMSWILPSYAYSNLDSNDVPIVQYPFGDYRNPVVTCHTAIAFHQKCMDAFEESIQTCFLNNADWLLDNLDADGYLHYLFEFDHSGRTLDSGWTSGMAQGEALSVLSMAYNQTQEPKYLEGAHKVFDTFKDSSSQYNFMNIENDYLYFEEYPNDDTCHVLNGFIFGAWGLWDYYVITASEESLSLFQGFLRTVIDNYNDWYLAENKTKYCLHNIFNPVYHTIHLQQIESLYALTKNPEFLVIQYNMSH
jgi:heparosan-N-sulfate-glucuronate 5-epimerase